MEETNVFQPDGWVNKYADGLFSYTIVRINDTGAAKDILQVTFLSA